MNRAMVLIFAATLLSLGTTFCQAAYPDKPVKIIVAYPAGGGPDYVVRVVAQKLNEKSMGPFVVENRPGANGTIAASLVVKAEPDGYTVLFTAGGPISIGVNLVKKLPYDPVKDLTPVTLAITAPLVLMVNASLPVTSVSELLVRARSSKKPMSYASSGLGSEHHLAGELLKLRGGIDLIHVPYKGFGAAVGDAIGGTVDLIFGTVPAALPHIAGGRLRPLGLASAARVPALPNVPTMEKSGLPDFEVVSWFGLLVPARTPPDIVQFLNHEFVKVLNTPDIRERFQQEGMIVNASTPDEFARYIATDTRRWAELVKAAHISID